MPEVVLRLPRTPEHTRVYVCINTQTQQVDVITGYRLTTPALEFTDIHLSRVSRKEASCKNRKVKREENIRIVRLL